jgi:hypothetical protein
VLRAEALGFSPRQPKPISRSDVQLTATASMDSLGDATVMNRGAGPMAGPQPPFSALSPWLLPSYGVLARSRIDLQPKEYRLWSAPCWTLWNQIWTLKRKQETWREN